MADNNNSPLEQDPSQTVSPDVPRSADEHGTRLYIENLAYSVNDEDLRILFSEFGPLRSNTIHYDRTGMSLGSADFVFSGSSDAIAAMRRYHNVTLDGRPIRIEIVLNSANLQN